MLDRLRRIRRHKRTKATRMLILHIGLPKTGTTFLQYQIFKRQKELHYVHDPKDNRKDAVERRLKDYFRCGDRSLKSFEASIPRALPHDEVLVSNENISILAPEVWRGDGPPPSRFSSRIRRLGDAVGGVRVILGIRRQDQWLSSRYAESAKHFEYFGQSDFETRMKEISESPLAGSLQWLEYAGTYRYLVDAIGRENVSIIPSEELLADPEPALGRLEEFLGHGGLVDAYRSVKSPTAVRRNVLSAGENRWTLRGQDGTITLPDDLRARLLRRFREENRTLDLALEGRLSAHGYCS